MTEEDCTDCTECEHWEETDSEPSELCCTCDQEGEFRGVDGEFGCVFDDTDSAEGNGQNGSKLRHALKDLMLFICIVALIRATTPFVSLYSSCETE